MAPPTIYTGNGLFLVLIAGIVVYVIGRRICPIKR